VEEDELSFKQASHHKSIVEPLSSKNPTRMEKSDDTALQTPGITPAYKDGRIIINLKQTEPIDESVLSI